MESALFQTPPYDLLSSDLNDYESGRGKTSCSNNISMEDIIRIIDGILWYVHTIECNLKVGIRNDNKQITQDTIIVHEFISLLL